VVLDLELLSGFFVDVRGTVDSDEHFFGGEGDGSFDDGAGVFDGFNNPFRCAVNQRMVVRTQLDPDALNLSHSYTCSLMALSPLDWAMICS